MLAREPVREGRDRAAHRLVDVAVEAWRGGAILHEEEVEHATECARGGCHTEIRGSNWNQGEVESGCVHLKGLFHARSGGLSKACFAHRASHLCRPSVPLALGFRSAAGEALQRSAC